MLEYPVLPFLVAAAVMALVGKRIGAVLLLVAPVVALVQLASVDRSSPHTLDYFGFELTYLRLDDLSAPFAYIFVGVAFLAGLYGATLLGTRERITALLTAGCGLGVVLAGDLLTLFVFWEMKAVASALLIAGTGPIRGPAAQRYLMVHVLGGSLLIGGMAWHLATDGTLAFDAFASSGATTMILLAFLVSAAMPPVHAWLPDAYPAASVAGMVFLSAYTTKSAVYALLRGFPGYEVLIVAGVVMALYGVVFAVLENDIRRLLAYHIVSQVGFMVAAVGVGTAGAVNGSTAHALAHILYKGLLVMGAGAVVLATGRSKLTDLGGLARRMPVIFVCTTIGAVSIAGVPLFSGFVSKELSLSAMGAADYGWAVDLLKLASVGTFLSVALKMLWFTFGGPDRGLAVKAVPATVVAALVLASASNVAIGLAPDLLYGVLPNPVDYAPFTAYKVSQTVQLLGFTALMFVLLLSRLKPKPLVTLDTDWLVRGAPMLVAARLRRDSPSGGWLAPVHAASTAVRTRVDTFRSTLPDPAATTSTAALGAVVLGTFLVVLARSLF